MTAGSKFLIDNPFNDFTRLNIYGNMCKRSLGQLAQSGEYPLSNPAIQGRLNVAAEFMKKNDGISLHLWQ